MCSRDDCIVMKKKIIMIKKIFLLLRRGFFSVIVSKLAVCGVKEFDLIRLCGHFPIA